MNRLGVALPIGIAGFLAIAIAAALAVRTGFVPDETVRLWAGAVAAGEGEMPVGRIVAVYPTVPFLATALLETVTPAGTPTPALLAAMLFGMLLAIWYRSFRVAGLTAATAAAMLLLIGFHPALVRAAMAGPADMFFVAFLFMLAKGLYDLRARSAAPEVMSVALALLGLSFSHPMGAAIALAVLPFLVLAVRPALVANSALNVIVALSFPTIFCIGAFTYVSWVFPGSGWSFLTAPAASLAQWSAGMSRILGAGLSGSHSLDAGLAIGAGFLFGAPAALFVVAVVRRRRPLIAPALVLIAASIASAVMAVAVGVFGPPVIALAAAPVLTASVIIRVPWVQERSPAILALLVVGWLGGAIALHISDPLVAGHLQAVTGEAGGDRERIDALSLGGATGDRDGVLVDAFNAPAVVLGRGHARGLLASENEAFQLTMLFGRIDAPFVAVPDPQTVSGTQDRLNKLFPDLYRAGLPGYRLVYQNTTWRLFERVTRRSVAND